ncbi:hypothetical protein [Planomicrobium sp. CPCC 101079]|uniref:hypothetical protein n=1 Tax=Planomicrobium sp. CPCC 101079 TaxID=2599618 RepID=UPI0011B55B78|nr:hypothetical protein [Planomicrobium sp. CPCC 101079]TWT04806.1 hypothetical protein FQV28_09380 [Planomicrobium sp. CPCC 101079]
MTDYNRMLDQLKAGEISSATIQKEEFLDFRAVLITRPDFKHFRGTAFHHGTTVYTYTEDPAK